MRTIRSSCRISRAWPALLLVAACGDDVVTPETASSLDPNAPMAAASVPFAPDLTGSWLGRSLDLESGVVEMNGFVGSDQVDRRLFGTLATEQGDFEVAGTVSATDLVSLVGRGIGTTPGAVQGLYRFVDFGGGAAALLGGFHTTGAGPAATRAQFLLRQYDHDEEEEDLLLVDGGWEGTLLSGKTEGSVSAELELEMGTNGAPTRFRGGLSLLPSIEQENLYRVEGSIDAAGNVVMVAVGRKAGEELQEYLVLEGQLNPGEPPPPCEQEICVEPDPEPSRIDGIYRIFGGNNAPSAIGPTMLVDFGTFEIIAILIGL